MIGWLNRLTVAIERGYFTMVDNRYAQCWATCAIGELLADNYGIIEKKFYDPDANEKAQTTHDELIIAVDPKLEKLGLRFYDCVRFDRISRAMAIYKKIQEFKIKQ